MMRFDEAWRILTESLLQQPRCPQHPEYTFVPTLGQGVKNDVIQVTSDLIVVRSHRTMREDTIPASRIRTWWEHLENFGTAALAPEDAPDRWRSRIVGAILFHCLPDHLELDESTMTLQPRS